MFRLFMRAPFNVLLNIFVLSTDITNYNRLSAGEILRSVVSVILSHAEYFFISRRIRRIRRIMGIFFRVFCVFCVKENTYSA